MPSPPDSPSFAAVLFDLDNTLCRHDQPAETIYFGAFERAGIDPFGSPEDLWEAMDEPTAPDDQRVRLERAFERVVRRYDRPDADAAALTSGLRAVVDWSAVSFHPGATDTLEAARTNGHVGLVTNGPERRQSVKLRALGIEDSFDVVVFAGDMRRRKPHADPFECALDALGVEPSDALYVGDSLEHDVGGAYGAGLKTAWYPPSSEATAGDHDPDYVLERLTDLDEIIAGVATV